MNNNEIYVPIYFKNKNGDRTFIDVVNVFDIKYKHEDLIKYFEAANDKTIYTEFKDKEYVLVELVKKSEGNI